MTHGRGKSWESGAFEAIQKQSQHSSPRLLAFVSELPPAYSQWLRALLLQVGSKLDATENSYEASIY